ncbi:hypothetical protein KXD93_25910 [Mucilaginibacter sp. BJC16-A38]|uniref:hypothetical protein n=1 Tax=Mucilaginibacter phenanthrenivorans TaxID=1234842 RepID=UPI002157B96B|nr:hypothetical protein [Mucilaginibacter phenanthrenivorans]MCR8561120.1 hypothetical protein [Mucilaginibacter phenanthrenivorans]
MENKPIAKKGINTFFGRVFLPKRMVNSGLTRNGALCTGMAASADLFAARKKVREILFSFRCR